MKKLVLTYAILFFCFFAIAGCAKRIAPDGGPKDLLPPNMVSITPAHNSTNVPTNATVNVVFDEPISANEAAIVVFPHDEIFEKMFSG